MRIARLLWIAFLIPVFAAGIQALWVAYRPPPQDLPWTRLDLRAPIGLFTGRKLSELRSDPQLCRSLLREASVRFTPLPPRHDGPRCGWRDAVRLTGPVRPDVPLSCPLAAALDLWMRQVVQPAAADLLGSGVARVEHFGSYACRRVYGRSQGDWSEHAFANAVDIAGFRLLDGRRVTVARDWTRGARGAFLHRICEGARGLFGTTLSPAYNAAHRDHLHLDAAARIGSGFGVCGSPPEEGRPPRAQPK